MAKKGLMKKLIVLIFIFLISATYGLLVGVYRIFPFALLQNTKDRIENNFIDEDAELEKQYSQINLDDIVRVTPENIDSLRVKMNTIIFDSELLPNTFPDSISEIEDPYFSDLDGLKKIEQFVINQTHEINSIGYIFHPKNPVNRLIVYHQGHGGDFSLGKKSIEYFVERGFTVYAFSMPTVGRNNHPIIQIDNLGELLLDDHEKFKFLKNPLQYFISPIITMINYASDKNYKDISMVGISGGGWTTTLAAAVDSRIKFSAPIAGTYPMFIHFRQRKSSFGDFEQTNFTLLSEINYLDMYILGSVGQNRKQLQILNKYDSCCFNGADYKIYEQYIAEKCKKFNSGSFSVFSDTSHSEHKISNQALFKIIEALK